MHAAPLELALQRQWSLVMQRVCVWHRSLAVHTYWELAQRSPNLSAEYAHALQFVDWCPSSADDAHAVAEYLQHQLVLNRSLEGEPLLHHMRAITFTVERLRLPMLDYAVAEMPFAAIQEWASYTMRTASEPTHRMPVTKDAGGPLASIIFG